jgi:hypothetical protein
MPALERIRELYPEPLSPTPDSRARARRLLVARLEHRPPRRLSRRAFLPAAGLAVAATAAVVALVGIGDEAAIDARAATVLRQAAAHARAQKIPGEGPVLYVRSVNAYMATSERDFSVLEPHTREVWVGPKGGRVRSTTGTPRFLSERDRRNWIAAGRPEIEGGRNFDLPIPREKRNALPSDPDALFDELEDSSRGHSEGTYREMFTLAADAFRATNITPALRAALYEVVAQIPGVELIGPVKDPVGRPGVAVAMDHPNQGTRHTLVIDPDTGTMLSEQQVTLEKNFYRYPAGTVVGHSTYVVTAMVESVGTRHK